MLLAVPEDAHVKTIPDRCRKLMLEVVGAHAKPDQIAMILHYLYAHYPREILEPSLRWLIRQRLTEQKFLDWHTHDCGGSNLAMHKKLISIMENEKVIRPIFAGKDFRT